jgi:hypothetical protein
VDPALDDGRRRGFESLVAEVYEPLQRYLRRRADGNTTEDHWYKGGDADQITIAQPDPQSSVALDGVTFEQGKSFLLTVTNGTVNGCGFSGPATPQLQQSFKDAFAG